jgi:hypothetical protein
MCRLVYWAGIALGAIGTAVAICLLDPSKVLFPGLLTLFSFSLIWTTQDSRLTRENPKILVHRGSIGLLSRNTRRKEVVCVSNPGALAGTLTKIDYRVRGESIPEVRWTWQSLYPELTPRPNEVVPLSSPPVPLLPGGLIALYTTTIIDPVPEDAYLHLTFRMGGYKERTMKWRVEPLKSAVEEGED